MAGDVMCGRGLQKLEIDRTLLWAWGANSHGQLGIGCISEKVIPSDKPVPFSWRSEPDVIKDAGGGGGFSYVVTESGKVFTCGNNNKGQLGQGTMENMTVFSHCQYLSQLKILKVAAGWDFMLGLSGSLLSWGSNMFGQLGRTLHGRTNYDAVPAEVNIQGRPIDIAAGLRHGLSLSECGKVYAWGHGKRGQLSDSDKRPLVHVEHPVHVQVSGTEKPVQLLAGMYHSGLLTEAGSVLMWGCNKFGQCGKDTAISQTVLIPNQVVFPTLNSQDTSSIVSVASGWTHIVALTENGQVYSWGWNEHSICGTEHEENVLQPHRIPQFLDKHVIVVGCGAGHSFCILTDAACKETS